MKLKRLRKNQSKERAAQLSEDLRRSEYALFAALHEPGIMTIQTQGHLVAMARKLRTMRYEIEADAGI